MDFEDPLSTNESDDYEKMMELGFCFDESEKSTDYKLNIRGIVPYTMRDLDEVEQSNLEYICIIILCVASLARFPGNPGKEIMKKIIERENAAVFFSGLITSLVNQGRIRLDCHYDSGYGIVIMRKSELNRIIHFVLNGITLSPRIQNYCDFLENHYLNRERVVSQLEKIYFADSSVSVYFRI